MLALLDFELFLNCAMAVAVKIGAIAVNANV